MAHPMEEQWMDWQPTVGSKVIRRFVVGRNLICHSGHISATAITATTPRRRMVLGVELMQAAMNDAVVPEIEAIAVKDDRKNALLFDL